MAQTILDRKIGPIPPSGLGPDGKLRVMTEEEHRQYIESALRRIDEIEQIPGDSSRISTRLSRDSTWCLSGLGLRLAVFDGF